MPELAEAVVVPVSAAATRWFQADKPLRAAASVVAGTGVAVVVAEVGAGTSPTPLSPLPVHLIVGGGAEPIPYLPRLTHRLIFEAGAEPVLPLLCPGARSGMFCRLVSLLGAGRRGTGEAGAGAAAGAGTVLGAGAVKIPAVRAAVREFAVWRPAGRAGAGAALGAEAGGFFPPTLRLPAGRVVRRAREEGAAEEEGALLFLVRATRTRSSGFGGG